MADPLMVPKWIAAALRARAKSGLPMDEASRLGRATEQGFTFPWYHGTARADRLIEKGAIDPKRATSGPMPFFSDNPEMASSYGLGKKGDTSLAAKDTGNVADYFTVSPRDLGWAGARTPVSVERSWYSLTPEQKAVISDRAPRIGYKDRDMADGPFMLHPSGSHGGPSSPDHWNYILQREAKNNPLSALRDLWHDSGILINNEHELMDIYRLAGYPHQISDASAPWISNPGVLKSALRLGNPLNTSNTEEMSQRVVPALEQAFKYSRARTEPYGADMWAKNSQYTPKSWTSQLKEDIGKGQNPMVFTSIPDPVTNELKKLGYNSILDTGGKMGGDAHKVAIPFDPSQVRSYYGAAFDPKNTFNPDPKYRNWLLSSMAAPVVAPILMNEENK